MLQLYLCNETWTELSPGVPGGNAKPHSVSFPQAALQQSQHTENFWPLLKHLAHEHTICSRHFTEV